MSDWDDKTMQVPTPQSALDPERDASSLGNLLRMHKDDLTHARIEEALAYQRRHEGMKLGEALITLGYVDEGTVMQACEDQALLRHSQPSTKRSALIMRAADQAQKQVGSLDDAIDRFTDLVKQIANKIQK